jgi:hypothetical protein
MECKWCNFFVQDKNFCSRTCQNRFISSKNDYKTIANKLTKPVVLLKCLKCQTEFKPDGKKKFCGRSCAASFNNENRTKESRLKQSKTIKQKFLRGEIKIPLKIVERYQKICLFCNQEFKVIKSLIKQEFCNIKCKRSFQSQNNEYQHYKNRCKFKFSLNSFPNEFDFKLIETFGWYSPNNKKNNLQGVSRDHILSISDGWKNKIPPEIVSHPANCQLLLQSKNASKHKSSSITLEELEIKIKEWDLKYSTY